MSRFADPSATRTVDLGPCDCPGAPHERDEVVIRAEATTSDVRRFVSMTEQNDDGVSDALATFITEWNLLGLDGKPWPPSAEAVRALKIGTATALIEALNAVMDESAKLPNGSGAPSVASSRGSASQTRSKNRAPTT